MLCLCLCLYLCASENQPYNFVEYQDSPPLGPLHVSQVIGLAWLPGRTLWCVHTGNFSPVDWVELKNTTKMAEHKTCFVRDCHSFVDSCNFPNKVSSYSLKVERHTRPKLIITTELTM